MSSYVKAVIGNVIMFCATMTIATKSELDINAEIVNASALSTIDVSYSFQEGGVHLEDSIDDKNMEKQASHQFSTRDPNEHPLKYLWLVRFNAWYQTIHGYLSLLVCSFGICSNIINILVLTRPLMVSPTNILLTIVACTDILTMISYLPYAVYFYCYSVLEKGKGHSRAWIMFMIFHNKFVITCHTAAMWLTVLLAVFRYAIVSRPHFFLSHGARRKSRRRSTLTPYWWRIVRISVLGVLGTTVLFCAPFYVLHKPVSLDDEQDKRLESTGQAVAYGGHTGVAYGGYTGVASGPGDHTGAGRTGMFHDEEIVANETRNKFKIGKNENYWNQSPKVKYGDLCGNVTSFSSSNRSLASVERKILQTTVPTLGSKRKLGYWIAVNDFIPDEVMAFNFWLFGVLLKLAPCCLLSILSFLLVKTMRRANVKRKRLKQQQQQKRLRHQPLDPMPEHQKSSYFRSCCNCYCCCHIKWCYCCCGFSCAGEDSRKGCANDQNYCAVVDEKEVKVSSPQKNQRPEDEQHENFETPLFEKKQILHGQVHFLKSQSPLSGKSRSLLELPIQKEAISTKSYDNLVKRSSSSTGRSQKLRAAKEASRRNLSTKTSGRFIGGSPKAEGEGAKLAVVVELHPGIQIESVTSSRSSHEMETCSDKLSAMKTASLSKLSSSSLAVPGTVFELDTRRATSSLTSLQIQRSETSLASHQMSTASLTLLATTVETSEPQKASVPTESDAKNRSLSVNFSLRPSSSTTTIGSTNFNILSSASSAPSSPEVDCNRTTAMLVAVVLTFVATELPPGVIALWSGFDSKVFDDIYVPLGDVWDILVLVNSSVNFVLYCTMSRQFRRTFSKMFAAGRSSLALCLGRDGSNTNKKQPHKPEKRTNFSSYVGVCNS